MGKTIGFSVFVLILIFIHLKTLANYMPSRIYNDEKCVAELKAADTKLISEVCKKKLLIAFNGRIPNQSVELYTSISSLCYILMLLAVGGVLGGTINYHNDEKKCSEKNTLDLSGYTPPTNNSGIGKYFSFKKEYTDKDHTLIIGFCSAIIGVPFLAAFGGLSFDHLLLNGSAEPKEFLRSSITVLGLAGLSGFLGTKLIEVLADNLLSSKVEDVQKQQDIMSKEVKAIVSRQYYDRGVALLNKGAAHEKKEEHDLAAKHFNKAILLLKKAEKHAVFDDELAEIKLFKAYIFKRLESPTIALDEISNAERIDENNILIKYNKICYMALTEQSLSELKYAFDGFMRLFNNTTEGQRQVYKNLIIEDIKNRDLQHYPYLDGFKDYVKMKMNICFDEKKEE